MSENLSQPTPNTDMPSVTPPPPFALDKDRFSELANQELRGSKVQSKHVFVIDDDREIRTHLGTFLEDLGFRVTRFGSSREALNSVKDMVQRLNVDVDLIISDIRMPDLSGIDLLKAFKEMAPTVPIILVTAFAQVDSAVEAMKYGAYDYVTKPFQLDRLEVLVERAIQHQTLARENVSLKSKLKTLSKNNPILGESQAMRDVMGLIERISQTNASVLITGESGTGKEMIARAIHDNSPRAKKSMVAVNCSAIPDTLLESELFGHAKGSFTGAIKHRQGLFEEADGGTLFLDEIGDLDLQLQAKLLRVLQEKEIRVVGENKSKPVDVRIIAATHRDLRQEMEKGTFREDLYYRLNVISVHLPSLQQRKSDIPILARHFLMKYSSLYGTKARDFTQKAFHKLMNLRWKGNVRELENTIERAIVFCKNELVDDMDIMTPAPTANESQLMEEIAFDLPTLKKVEERYVQFVLDKSSGEKAKAAQVLGVSQRTLYRKIDEIHRGSKRNNLFMVNPEPTSRVH
jgi:DNA-binding NtrC family response regulator